ncbi:peptidoglycan-binding domain-containing protein [Chryseobacterium sp.]|uniref:peptidoglycan-binding domain-containing protein n=1 Tax=Chryseobacterium sp. TaxID=1871047 RepID=UPI00289CB42D|nr:peptidoglycan-binding domain-containing protein [Chryseobacterium sp.]
MSENKSLIIIGSHKPVIGTKEMYSVSSVNDWLHPLKPIKNPLQVPKTYWEVMVETKTGWRKGGSDKEGQTVPFTFGQKSLFHKGIKIIARQGADYAELIVHPQRAKESKITRVELLDANYKPIPKGKKLSYKDTIIARAYCVEMFEMNIAFTLWEDDAQGAEHNPVVNAFNKINPVPVMGRVNERGMAEAVFRLPFYTMAVLIANTRTASGDKSEGATHEYYVTADVVSKYIQKASPNVTVVNPTHNPEPPRKREWPKGYIPSPTKPKPESEKPKPNPDSPKFPVTTGGKKSGDPQGKILSAEFVDKAGNRLHFSKVGTTVFMKITAKDMKNKKVKVKIWEEDNIKWTNDLIFEKDCILIGDNNYINNVQLTKQMFDKAQDGGTDSARQDYFIEVIHHDTSVTSEVMPVSADAEPTKVETGNSATMVEEPKLESKNCGGKYCIDKNSAPSELIREINIRLAGFGGNVPTDKFTDRTEKMIKQFQRDYMKAPETGKVCGNVLKAIDDFSNKYTVNINEGKCPCKKCTGFGKGLYSEERNNAKILEKSRKYEYPGIHRSLLWVEKAIKFYLANQEKQIGLRVGKINSGYRCNANNKINKRHSTNHMGKALDIHIYKLSDSINTEKNADKVRDVLIKYTNAKYRWKDHNVFALEPSSRNRIDEEYIATTWVHYDVRTFDLEYLKDEYFVKDNNSVNGENIIALASKLGYQNACNCSVGSAKENKTEESKKTDKYKWAHSKFGNLIAKVESSDDYNKCNKTEKVAYKVNGKIKYKRVVKVVNSVKVVETTIKEIQKKQADKDLFAVGRYQLIPETLKSAVLSLSLDINKKLDQETQDKIFDDYLIKVKRPKIIGYLEASGAVEDAMYSAAQEWASIGVEKGKRISDKLTKSGEKIIRYAKNGESYYADDGLNRAHVTPEEIKEALINSKNDNK